MRVRLVIDKSFDFAGATGRCSFRGALVQVNVAGVNTETVEEVSPVASVSVVYLLPG